MKVNRLFFWLACASLCANSSGAAVKEKAGAKFKSPATLPAHSQTNTVEELAARAKRSIVVISHFGRDGAVDGVGAGFVVSSNGLIATSLHVIGEARPITVQTADGRRFEVTEVFASDRKVDLAVIKVEATDLKPLPLGDSDTLKQGTPIVAIGNPRGLEHSVVQGVLSAKRDVGNNEMLQLAIPVEPGNSGGPVIDLQGHVQGVMTMKSAMTENLGFAMPVNALKPLLDKPNPVPMSRWLTIGVLNPKEWEPLFGARWSQKSGRIQVEGTGMGFGGRSLCLSLRELPPPPYELAVTVKLEDESGAAGLVFASDGDDRHYGFYPSAGQLRLTRFDGPTVYQWTILKQAPSAHYRSGDWNTLKVRFEPGRILCYVNDQLTIESEDDGLARGKVGLAKFRNTVASFRNFQVGEKLPASAPSPDIAAAVARELENLPRSGRLNPALVDALEPHAQAGLSVLEQRARKLQDEAAQLRKLATAVHQKAIQNNLLSLFSQPEDKIDLFRAALLVARLDNPDLDVEAYLRQLDELAHEVSAKLPADADAPARLQALRQFLFEEGGFHGSRQDYYNRANSYVNEVLDDREGLPITLSVVFIELARRIGLEGVSGVGLPSHFIVQFKPKAGETQYLDVFEGGKRLTRRDLTYLSPFGAGDGLEAPKLEPAAKRDIIVRMLRNLISSTFEKESPETSLRYLNVILALSPEAGLERWGRAMLRLQTGDQTGAREDLLWLADHRPPGVDSRRVEEILRSL